MSVLVRDTVTSYYSVCYLNADPSATDKWVYIYNLFRGGGGIIKFITCKLQHILYSLAVMCECYSKHTHTYQNAHLTDHRETCTTYSINEEVLRVVSEGAN